MPKANTTPLFLRRKHRWERMGFVSLIITKGSTAMKNKYISVVMVAMLFVVFSFHIACAEGWKKSYHAGTFDKNFKYMGGTELMFLTVHKGKLYAATSMWMNPDLPYSIGSQIHVKKSSRSRWKLDYQIDKQILRVDQLVSITPGTDGQGNNRSQPVKLLLAGMGVYDSQLSATATIREDLDRTCGIVPDKKGSEEKKTGQKTANSNTGQRFVDNGDGTVSDTKTGLMWLKDANPCGEKDWVSAKSYCEHLIYVAYSDWRLPTELELRVIGSNSSGTWTIPGAPFVNVQSSNYWSGTESAISPDQAWSVYMNNGQRIYFDKSHNDYVWPVRGGN